MQIELIIERIKMCRQDLGITQQEAAKLIGVSQPAYQRYEAGLRNPSIQVAKEIAAAFNTSVDYLIGESDDTVVSDGRENQDAHQSRISD